MKLVLIKTRILVAIVLIESMFIEIKLVWRNVKQATWVWQCGIKDYWEFSINLSQRKLSLTKESR